MALSPSGQSALLIEARAMKEDALQRHVLHAAQTLGWLRAHFRPAMTKDGWRTPVQGDGVGFPDLILLRGTRGLAVELKSHRGKVTAEQQLWLDAFERAGFEVYTWRPLDWITLRIRAELLAEERHLA